jgi:biotin transporter BioY
VAIIYAFGLPVLMSVANLSFEGAWAAGAAPFILFDLVKSALASSLSEGGRRRLAQR